MGALASSSSFATCIYWVLSVLDLDSSPLIIRKLIFCSSSALDSVHVTNLIVRYIIRMMTKANPVLINLKYAKTTAAVTTAVVLTKIFRTFLYCSVSLCIPVRLQPVSRLKVCPQDRAGR